jgi:hypothetical protein
MFFGRIAKQSVADAGLGLLPVIKVDKNYNLYREVNVGLNSKLKN